MNKSQKGFTLIELIIVILIIGIISTIAVTTLNARKSNDEVSDVAYTFRALVSEARNAAINYRSRVQFRFSPHSMEWCVGSCYGNSTAPRSTRQNFPSVTIAKYARVAAIDGVPPSTIYNLPNTYRHFYIEPDGMIIGYTTDRYPRGITLYLQHKTNNNEKYRVAIMPLLGKGKVIDMW